MGGADNKSRIETLIFGGVGRMQMDKGAEGVARKSFSEWVIFKVTLRDNSITATCLIWDML